MSKTKENQLKKIELLGKRYVEKFLTQTLINKDTITKDWYQALLVFFSKSFYRGRRDSISEVFQERAVKVIEDYYQKHKNFGKLDFNQFNKSLIDNGVNNNIDRKMVCETIKFIESISESNIVNYSVNQIKKSRSEDIFDQLQEIHGIGDKLASFYLRDIAIIYELEDFINKQTYKYFQPIDTWVLQVATAVGLIKKSDKNLDAQKQKIISGCLKYGVSPLLFNAGAWYLGTHSFQLLLDVYGENIEQ